MSRVSFAWLIHSHQPVGNFDHVIEEAYERAYAPFLTVLALHPRVRTSLHFSGVLLEWIEKQHPEYFHKLRKLIARGQVELVGGGYFEPVLPGISDHDKVAQIRRLTDYLSDRFGAAPRGAWVAERVWEPSLPRPLAEAGIEYVLLDDTHFLAAGLEPGQLHGTYVTEEVGFRLRLVPSLKALRYTIPFREPEETLRLLREGADTRPPADGTADAGMLFAMGDDCEKFGVWPGTYEHVYKSGWLERFLQALDAAADWLEITTLSDYVNTHPPAGRIYLPTASYAEMMAWALPVSAARELKAALEESAHAAHGERLRRFMCGGLWHNFLSKYSESNQIHKLMLNASRRWHNASLTAVPGSEAAGLLRDAQTHVLAAQCNDAYWHGVFGGLYAPHLRSGVLRHLIEAETTLDQVDRNGGGTRVAITDFDADGQEEILAEDAAWGMVLRPADGATVSSLRFKPAAVELINSLTRRPEPYHDEVRRLAAAPPTTPGEGPASIHDLVLSKEANLKTLLRYDRYARHAFRTYVFPASKQFEDFRALSLEENESLARGEWKRLPGSLASGVFELEREASLPWGQPARRVKVTKAITTSSIAGPVAATKMAGRGEWRVASGEQEKSSRSADNLGNSGAGKDWTIECRSSLEMDGASPWQPALGVELVFNLLAPNAPDRHYLAGDARHPLEFSGELRGARLLLVDKWQRVKILLSTQPEACWWVVPIETVSQSETGFERVYQGSAIMVVWKLDPTAWRDTPCIVAAEIFHSKAEAP